MTTTTLTKLPADVLLRFEFEYRGTRWTYEGTSSGVPYFAWRGCIQPYSAQIETACAEMWAKMREERA